MDAYIQKYNMHRSVNSIYSIYKSRSFKIVSNNITRRASSGAFLVTKYRRSRCLNITDTV